MNINKTETINKYKMMDILHFQKLALLDGRDQATARRTRNEITHGILVLNLIADTMRMEGLITQEEYNEFMGSK